MRIAFIGKFKRLHDEEYIARSFEMLGHEVIRVHENYVWQDILDVVKRNHPDVVLCTKLNIPKGTELIDWLTRMYPTASWNFDLYWDYPREHRLSTTPGFRAKRVFTTDGGHRERWKNIGVQHQCIRQGIYKEECFISPGTPKGIVFVGSDNPYNVDRKNMMNKLSNDFEFSWIGKNNTEEIRGTNLNQLYGNIKIVVGDSVYSPYYWSNRVVETLGRGGFLIHRDVPGITDEYPNLVTYDGTYEDLKKKIEYYLSHEDERQEIVRKNFELVKSKYTMDKKCAELISHL